MRVDHETKCPECGTYSAIDANYCSNCAHEFGPSNCPNCQAELQDGATFCSECGLSVRSSDSSGGPNNRVSQNVRVIVDRRGGCASGCLIPLLLLVVVTVFVCGAAI